MYLHLEDTVRYLVIFSVQKWWKWCFIVIINDRYFKFLQLSSRARTALCATSSSWSWTSRTPWPTTLTRPSPSCREVQLNFTPKIELLYKDMSQTETAHNTSISGVKFCCTTCTVGRRHWRGVPESNQQRVRALCGHEVPGKRLYHKVTTTGSPPEVSWS